MKRSGFLIVTCILFFIVSCTKTHSEHGIKKWEGTWKIDLYLLDENVQEKFFSASEYKSAKLSVADYGLMSIDKDLNGKLTLDGKESTFYLYYNNDIFFNLKNWRTLDGAKIWEIGTDFYFIIKDKKGKERFLEISDVFSEIFPLQEGSRKMYLKLTKI